MKTHRYSTRVMTITLVVILAMLITPLAALASSPAAPAGPQQLKGRALLDSLSGRQFANERPARDDLVVGQAAGVPIGATAAEAKAITDTWLASFAAKKAKSGPNPIAFEKRSADLASAESQGLSPRAAGLGEIGEAKMLMIPFEFNGSDTLDRCDADGNLIDQVTVTGPLNGTIPDPALDGDNNTIWTDDFSVEWYQNLMFGDGVGVVRTDLNGGAGVDLSGVSATNWYEEQSEGLYTIDGDIYPAWIQLDHSVAYYGWDGDELSPDGVGYPCDGTASGYGFEFTIDVVNKLNEIDPNFDWYQYDTNDDQIVDHLMVIHAGVDNSAGGGTYGNYQLWAHSWDVYCPDANGDLQMGCLVEDGGTPNDPSDDVYVSNYTHIPEDADIGVVVHEYGHDIGLPDYYDQTGATSNSTAHWIVMSGGSWSGDLGGSHPAPFNPWARYFFGWEDPTMIDYMDGGSFMMGQSDPTPAGTEDSVWINLPDQAIEVENMAGDGKGLHTILGNEMFSPLMKEFDLSGTTAPVFSFDTYFDIEEDWDYVYLRASTDGGATWDILLNNEGVYATADPNGSFAWLGEGGLTGEYDGALTYDLSAYAGNGSVWVQFAYVTDQSAQNPGMWIDNLSLDDDGSNLYFNDLEDASDWDNDGWEEVPYSVYTSHYYMLEWRNDEGSIASHGHTGQYYSLTHDQSGWLVDKFSANVPGLLVWYRNNFYSNNQAIASGRYYDPPATGPKGELLLADSHNDAIPWSGGWWEAGQLSNRRTAMDGALSMYDGPAWMIHDEADSANPVMDFGSAPAMPAFHDSMRSVPGWAFPGDGFVYRVDQSSSVVIPAASDYSTRIRELDENGNPGADLTGFWGYTVGGQVLGSGNPGDSNSQYGVHVEVVDQAADGTYGVINVWNAMDDFSGGVTQTASTNPAVMGTYVDVEVDATNVGSYLMDTLFMVPVDPDTEYVDGSAWGGAFPMTAAYAAQLAAERGLTDLAALAGEFSPEDVVAIGWAGETPTGFNVNFGFAVKITNAPSEVHHTAAIFDGATLVSNVSGEPLTVEDNSSYPVERSRRFNVDRDSYINGTRPNTYFGSDQTMWLGFYDQMRPVVHTPLNGIARDSAVDQAWLYLYVTDGRKFGDWQTSLLEQVVAHGATTEWMPYAVNWWMPWTMPGGDYAMGGTPNHLGSGKIGTWLRLDVTAAVEDMLRSGYNQGFLLNSSVNDSGVHYGLATKEYWDASKTGYIRVYFRTAN